jgi:phosphate acetyltransferase
MRLLINMYHTHRSQIFLNSEKERVTMVLHGLVHRPKIVGRLLSIAKTHQKKIIFPEWDDDRVLEGAIYLGKQKIVQAYLIGDTSTILKRLSTLKLDAKHVTIIDMNTLPDFTQEFVEIRKKANVTVSQTDAKELFKNPMWASTMLLKQGKIDGIVYGAAHATADTLRPALQIIGLAKGVTWASSYFMILHEKKLFFFSDCAFNINPNAEQLAQIAIVTHDTAKFFGLMPKVAMLSFSTKGSGKHPDADKVANATAIVKKLRPEIIIDGEMQFDAAFVPSVAKFKAPNSPIVGDANVFIFPNLDAGNIAYKIAQRLAHDLPIGPITQGFAKPVNDLSRGCTVDEIIEVGALTAIQAVMASGESVEPASSHSLVGKVSNALDSIKKTFIQDSKTQEQQDQKSNVIPESKETTQNKENVGVLKPKYQKLLKNTQSKPKEESVKKVVQKNQKKKANPIKKRKQSTTKKVSKKK